MSQGALKGRSSKYRHCGGELVSMWTICVQLQCVKNSIDGWLAYRRIQRAASDAEWRWDRRWIGVENKSGQ